MHIKNMNIGYYFIKQTLYPIVVLTFSLICGICSAYYDYIWIMAFFFCLIMAIIGIIFHRTHIAAHPIYIFFYLTAYCFGFHSYHKTIHRQQDFFQYTNGKTFNIKGEITSIHRTVNPYLHYSVHLKILNMTNSTNLENGNVYHNHDTLCIYLTSIHNLRIADTIEIQNIQFKTNQNTEFMNYLLKEHIISSAVADNKYISLINRPFFSLSRMVHEYKNRTLYRFKKCMDKETFLAFSSIFLGEPVAKKKEDILKSQLRVWGLFHYIARAGLHLVIFVSIWVFIFGLLPCAWFIRQLLIIILCSLYFILTWSSIPFNRAFFTLLFVRSCNLLKIKTYPVPAISFIALLTLIETPSALFALDFQLSFGVTFGLALFNEIKSKGYRYQRTIA